MRRAILLPLALAFAALVSCGMPTRQSEAMAPERTGSLVEGASKNALPGAGSARIAVEPSLRQAHPIISLLNVRSPMIYGEYRWNEDGVPAGPIWVLVDLRQQLISVFRSGQEIGTSVILYGADKKPTPLGTFSILARFKDHRSGPYDAPMPYTLRLTPDGVSIHGSNVRWGSATHGCIGVPLEFAQRLFEQVRVGDPVVITNDVPSHILS